MREGSHVSNQRFEAAVAALSIRIDFDSKIKLGPGKVRLLELINEHGSISAAGRAMEMSYRRAWTLIEDLNTGFGEDVVASQVGGKHGGGARLTPFGAELVAQYRAIEAAAAHVANPYLQSIEQKKARQIAN